MPDEHEGLVGYIPRQQVGLFRLKLSKAGFRHLTGRVDVEEQYASTHEKVDGQNKIRIATKGTGTAVAVFADTGPAPSRIIATFLHDLFGAPDFEKGRELLEQALKAQGFNLSPKSNTSAHEPTSSPSRVAVYVAFDFDNDLELKNLLVAQARNPDSPFEVADFSLHEAEPEPMWADKARQKIRRVQKVIVIVGTATHRAPGVMTEVEIARSESVSHFAIRGRRELECPRPAWIDGPVHDWTWENLKALIHG